jgi:hypothetical protein
MVSSRSGAVIPTGKNVERASVIQPRHPASKISSGNEEAVAAYRDALAQDPLLHDAHLQSIQIA